MRHPSPYPLPSKGRGNKKSSKTSPSVANLFGVRTTSSKMIRAVCKNSFAGVMLVCDLPLLGFHLKNMAVPWNYIEIKTARLQIGSISFVKRVAQQIAQLPWAAAQIRKWKTYVALSGLGSEIHDHQQARVSGILPCKGDESVERKITVPCRNAFEQLPLPLPNDGTMQNFQQPSVEFFQAIVDGFFRLANEVG